jgi:ribosomal protein L40E
MLDSKAVIASRGTVIALVLVLIILTILASVAYKFPSAIDVVYPEYVKIPPEISRISSFLKGGTIFDHKGFLLVGDIIRLVIWTLMIVMLLYATPSLATLIHYYIFVGVRPRVQQEAVEISSDIEKLSSRITNILIIAILWPIVAKIVNTLLFMDAEGRFDWIMLLITLSFVTALLSFLFLAYRSAQSVLEFVSRGKIKILCPKCGAANTITAKFCASCGTALEQKPGHKEEHPETTVICPQCGAENSRENKFCTQCGAPLAK